MNEEININYWVSMSSLTFVELAHLLADECPPSDELGLDDSFIIDNASQEVRNIYRLLCRAADDFELTDRNKKINPGSRIKPLLNADWFEKRKEAFPKGERFLKALSDASLFA